MYFVGMRVLDQNKVVLHFEVEENSSLPINKIYTMILWYPKIKSSATSRDQTAMVGEKIALTIHVWNFPRKPVKCCKRL